MNGCEHGGRKGGAEGAEPSPTSNQEGLSPPLICTQDYVYDNLLTEVVISPCGCVTFCKLIAVTKVLIERNALFLPYAD